MPNTNKPEKIFSWLPSSNDWKYVDDDDVTVEKRRIFFCHVCNNKKIIIMSKTQWVIKSQIRCCCFFRNIVLWQWENGCCFLKYLNSFFFFFCFIHLWLQQIKGFLAIKSLFLENRKNVSENLLNFLWCW